jgi:hypothetical protein
MNLLLIRRRLHIRKYLMQLLIAAYGGRAGRCSPRCSMTATWPRSPAPTTRASAWVVCKNPLLAEERARKRDELLAITEKELARISARVQRAAQAAARRRSSCRTSSSWHMQHLGEVSYPRRLETAPFHHPPDPFP